MKPTYEVTGETYTLQGRGTVYAARTTCHCTRDDLMELIGTELEGVGKIIDVESFAVEGQSFKPIGLLVADKERDSD